MHTSYQRHCSKFERDILASRPFLKTNNNMKSHSKTYDTKTIGFFSYPKHFCCFHPNKSTGMHLWARNIVSTMFSIDCPIWASIHSNLDAEFCLAVVADCECSSQAMDHFVLTHDSWRQSNDLMPLLCRLLNTAVHLPLVKCGMQMVVQCLPSNFQRCDLWVKLHQPVAIPKQKKNRTN